MSESETQRPDREPDLEGREAVLGHIDQQENQQIAENAEGESTRRRLLEAKQKREQEAEPFEHTFEEADDTAEASLDPILVGETFEFRPFPKELKNAFQEAVLKFAGADEEELTSEQAQRMDEVNERILDALALYSTDEDLDLEFWTEMTDMEDRQIMAGQLIGAQGK